MADDSGGWAALARWALENPKEIALAFVAAVGAISWIRKLIHGDREDSTREDLVKTLMDERKQLAQELRDERRRARRKAGDDENSGRPV